MKTDVELVVHPGATHGEGPSWDARRGVLYWVDITGEAIHEFDPRTKHDRAVPVGEMVGTVAPRAAGGVIAALRSGLAFVDLATGQVTKFAQPEADKPGNRFNDGKCDPAGRFWAGTCSLNCDVPGVGSLYRVDTRRQVQRVLDNLTIANGLAWSTDARTMYYIDTPTFEVWAFDFDVAAGALSRRRTAVKVPQEAGYPDGMTIDAEGMLWVAHWGGSSVVRWNPQTGERLATIALPVKQVSSCVFGGPDLMTLYITTSRLGLDAAARAAQPLAGAVFQVRPGVRGTPTFAFGD